MVTFSAVTGYLLTGNHLLVGFVYLFSGLFLTAAGASVLNQVQEYKRDALMFRTSNRPIPSGEISISAAKATAILLIASGAALLGMNGWLPMVLGLLNIVFYNLIYTPLKTRSWLAILPGAIVGGIPPLVGWSSAGHSLLHPNALFLFVFVCLWQVPHFWLLMIKYGKEYELAGFSSISKILSEAQIRQLVFFWGVVTSVFLMLFPLFGFYLNAFLVGLLLLINLSFILFFYRFLFLQEQNSGIGKPFVLINFYALLVFVILIVNAFLS